VRRYLPARTGMEGGPADHADRQGVTGAVSASVRPQAPVGPPGPAGPPDQAVRGEPPPHEPGCRCAGD